MDESRPIFQQIAEQIENDIIAGLLPEEAQVPSTNEFAAFHRINPATAGKGVNLLVDTGILYKKRGIGMFVAAGSRERLVAERRERFREQFVQPLLVEAEKLGISADQLTAMIQKGGERGPSSPRSTASPSSSARCTPSRMSASR
ncbi:MAG: GntR family transcriptional regulator [Pseudolysinimonas sp.]